MFRTPRGLVALILAIVFAAPAAYRVTRRKPSLAKRISDRIASFPGEMGVAVRDLESGDEIAFAGDQRFPTASLIKLAVMVEAYHQIDEGKLRRDTVIRLGDEDKAGDEAVVLNQMEAGLNLTVPDLLALMIAYSDNTATNLLIRLVGTANVDRRMESYGLAHTQLYRPTFRDGHPDVFPDLEKEFGLGSTTPREAARLMALIAEGKIVSRAACDEMIALLARQQDRQMIPRSLPFEREEILVANKTGWDEEKLPDASGFKGEIRTDAAYVKGRRARYVIAILTRRGRDKRPGADNDALVTGAAVSRIVYDELAHRGTAKPR
jgi:beta-lactamase class A